MSSEIIDNTEPIADESALRSALSWWEKKRIWFNVIVGAVGLIVVFPNIALLHAGEFIGIVLYGVLFNILYSVGFLLEALYLHYFKQSNQLEVLRYPLLVIGTIASSAVTFVAANAYFYLILS